MKLDKAKFEHRGSTPRTTEAPSVRSPFPGGLALFWVGVAIFMVSMFAGLIRSFMTRQWLPRVGVEYTTELNELVQVRGTAAVFPEIRSAARIDYDNAQALTRLLESARQAGDRDEIVWALGALTRVRPEDGQVRNEFVAALLEQDRFAEAYEQGKLAVWLNPNVAEAHYNFGVALAGLGQTQQAASAYGKALELDPTSEKARSALRNLLREL